MRAKRSKPNLTVAIQAVGVYFMCNSVFQALNAVARLIVFPSFRRDLTDIVPSAQSLIRTTVLEHLVYAVLYLLLAWVLLVKTDWAVRTVAGLSRPQVDEASADDTGAGTDS